ncbi:hypothetical protein FDP41_012579 [Naegleria fowleri]|uniref:Serine racemase n=1 Tax=Naegleria fowleri TaxID=5763 RepID=A0A6A5C7S3_NAEFO|nr:uncharacterized protein FDP41_012579 [Naegleria fowleri]KAF0981319.1 hypothetical protein FDP41_012579 [Naegleria fowleri]
MSFQHSSPPLTTELSIQDVERASERIIKYIHRTPVLSSSTLSAMTGIPGCTLYLKCENFNKVGAFKIRGATNAVLKALENGDDELKRKIKEGGVTTHSSGNHAQAIAKTSQMLGIPAHVVMPSNSPDVKKNAVEQTYGARVVLCEPTLKAREETCEKIMKETGAMFIHPYDNDDVIAGQGTAVKELLEQLKEEQKDICHSHFPLDVLIVPVGGGGLSSGSSLYFKEKAALELRDEKLEKNHVSDDQVLKAMKLVWERMKIVIEPSSATVVALALYHDEFKQLALENEWKNIGMIISGGNTSMIFGEKK